MVRSKPVMAADMQIAYLVDGIFRMTAFHGNYREIMPINGRNLILREGIRESPPPTIEIPRSTAAVKTDKEYRAMTWAKDALKIAKSPVDYVQDLDKRLRTAAEIRSAILSQPLPSAMTTPMPVSTTPPPYDLAKAVATMAASIAEAAKEAVKTAVEQMESQAKTAAEQAAQKAAMTVATGAHSLLPAAPPTVMPILPAAQLYRR